MVIHFMLSSFLVLKFHLEKKLDPMTSVLLKLICVGWAFFFYYYYIILLLLIFLLFELVLFARGVCILQDCNDCSYSEFGWREAYSNMWFSQ
jgi:hypothetical protein